jgi:hypothetical protein
MSEADFIKALKEAATAPATRGAERDGRPS